MPRKRKYISHVLKLKLLKELDFRCPFCSNRDIEHFEIHHIDSNIENNAFTNLLYVCPTCHSKITKGDIDQTQVVLLKERLSMKYTEAKPFKKVEIEAEYPGGSTAYIKFLRDNLRYPKLAIEQEIEGTVIVQFVVDEYGRVENVEAISGPLELQPEAIRVIKRSARWLPARQNGLNVKAYKKQPIIFKLEQEFSPIKNIVGAILNRVKR